MKQICVFNRRLFSLHNTLNYAIHRACLRMVLLMDVYRNLTSLWIKPPELAFKQFKSPVLNVLTMGPHTQNSYKPWQTWHVIVNKRSHMELQHLDIFRYDMCSSTCLLVSYQFVVCFYDVCKFVCQIILKQSSKQKNQCICIKMTMTRAETARIMYISAYFSAERPHFICWTVRKSIIFKVHEQNTYLARDSGMYLDKP